MGFVKSLIAAGLLIACVAAVVPPTLPQDFTAKISVNTGGVVQTGHTYQDTTGQRVYTWIGGMNQSTFMFQPFGSAVTYQFIITNSGCTCQRTTSAVVQSPFAQLATATKSSKGCPGGDLYVNAAFPAVAAAAHASFCVSGNKPIYSVFRGVIKTTYSDFKPGRDAAFPLEPLQSMSNECQNACL